MARPGLRNHPKFKRLMAMLKPAPESHVRGYLECIWETAYECGNPVIGDAEMVEAAAFWPGKKGKLFEALLACGGADRPGFIEEVPGKPGTYQVRDLYDHAPDYVKKRRDREKQRTSKTPPSYQNSRDSDAQNRSEVQSLNDNDLRKNCPVSDRTTAENGKPPTPTPAPIPPIAPQGGNAPASRIVVETKPTEDPDPLAIAKRYAVEQFDRWSYVGRGYDLQPERSETRKVWDLVEDLATEPPIVVGGSQVGQHQLLPQAIEVCIKGRKNFKSVPYAISTVRNLLAEWKVNGVPGSRDAPGQAKPRVVLTGPQMDPD